MPDFNWLLIQLILMKFGCTFCMTTIIIPWNAFKALDNQLKCQPSGVVEFCPKKEKVEGVACSCMNVKQYTCIMELFAHAETSLERSTRVGWTEACYA